MSSIDTKLRKMAAIENIDYIVYPLYDIGKHKEKNLGIFKNMIKHIKEECDYDDALTLVSFIDEKSINKYGAILNHVKPEDHEQAIGDYKKYKAQLLSELNKPAITHFVGTEKVIHAYGTGGEFDKFLERNDLTLSTKNLRIFGHGLHEGECIDDAIEKLAKVINDKHKSNATFGYARENTHY